MFFGRIEKLLSRRREAEDPINASSRQCGSTIHQFDSSSPIHLVIRTLLFLALVRFRYLPQALVRATPLVLLSTPRQLLPMRAPRAGDI
jgi:hypothetical protein